MINSFIRHATRWITQFLKIQLFLSLTSLPFIISWGLPYSAMTLVGNMLFNPFIFIFLTCSSLLFFTELCHIPNGWLVTSLEHITSMFSWTLSWGSPQWLIGLYKPSFIILIIMTLLPFILIHALRKSNYEIGGLVLLLCGYIALCAFIKPTHQSFIIPCTKNKFCTVVKEKNVIRLFENEAFSTKKASESWITYTLLPTLRQKAGISSLTSIIIKNPSGKTYETLAHLLKQIPIKYLFIPYFAKESMTHSDWRAFFILQKICTENSIKIIRTYK